MKDHIILKSCLASFAVLMLALLFSAFTHESNDFSPLIFYTTLFTGANFITYCFIAVIAVGYESALCLIFRNRDVWKIRMFLPSFMLLVVTPFIGVFLFFNNSWLDNMLNSSRFVMVMVRVCILVILMSCPLLIMKKAKK